MKYTILGGDFNCVLSERDTEANKANISKALLNLIRNLHLKDMWFAKNKLPVYTYIRNNFGSRIDRLYANDLFNNVKSINTINVNFSDHSCVTCEIENDNLPKTGKYYWKLNTALLELEDINDLFKVEWDRIKSSKGNYDNINLWWDKYAKREIKTFFIKIGKREIQNKYGLLKYLEFCLNKLYNDLNLTGKINYSEVKILKNRIDSIKTDILNGVRIRSRVDEQLQGETVSSYLIKQQSNVKCNKLFTSIKAETGVLENVIEGTEIKGKDAIELYINKYYEKLYKKENCNERMQEWFINFVENKLDEGDCNILEQIVTRKEIYDAIKDMKHNKSPGLDGLPIEFYVKFWDIIKNEFCEIIVNMIKGTVLQEIQRKAIIVLIHKGGEPNQLKNWRPVSLICADVKVVAKILSRRLRQVMDKII